MVRSIGRKWAPPAVWSVDVGMVLRSCGPPGPYANPIGDARRQSPEEPFGPARHPTSRLLRRYRAAVRGTLTFTRSTDVVPDQERPGLWRAQPVWEDDDGGDVHQCPLHDLAAPGAVEPGLEHAGFETIDLSGNEPLQRALRVVHEEDQLSESTAAAIRESLAGMKVRLGNGKTLRIDLVVDDGLFHRRSGPNGLDVNPGGIDGINGHGGAQYVHADQDVFGTPLRQLLHGAAPEMFRHITPDGRNDEADSFLLNLWIPLHAPVQPLALMDRRTLDASRHQLRYGLPVDDFLDRDEEAGVNDIWSFLHDDGQKWHVRTDMGPDQGFVFDTLGTPHGAAVLPGEGELEALYLALSGACDAFDGGDPTALSSVSNDGTGDRLPGDATPAIRDAWQRMSELCDDAADLSMDDSAGWCAQARVAMDAVIRRSVEMRLVATLIAG